MRSLALVLVAGLLWAAGCGTAGAPAGSMSSPGPVSSSASSTSAAANDAFRVAQAQRSGSKVTVQGQARVFEATFAADVVDATGAVVVHNTVHASAGAPAWGDFTASLALPAGAPATGLAVRLYEPSPKDGTPQNVLTVPVA